MKKLPNFLAGLYLLLRATAAVADVVERIPYDSIVTPPALIESFDSLHLTGREMRDGVFVLNGLISIDGATLGASFFGQRLQTRKVGAEWFDRVFDLPEGPLRLTADVDGKNLAVEENQKPGTLVLLGLGPAENLRNNALGEGSIAILFEKDVCQVGFIIEIEGAETYNTGFEGPGSVNVSFYSATGHRIDERSAYELGEIELGFGIENAAQGGIRGILIQNLDAAGVYIDDLVFLSECEPKIS